jgi:cobalt-zinc-cadmium efflux system outer membrane protein
MRAFFQVASVTVLFTVGLGITTLAHAEAGKPSLNPSHSPSRGALAAFFEQAWAAQPAAASLSERTRAASAQREAASTWTAAPPSIEVGGRTDRYNRDRGSREQEVGLVLPLWLPGERSQAQALADAEGNALQSSQRATQLNLAQFVRDAWWAWLAAANEADLAQARLAAASRLRDDVNRRFNAGDLSRADLNQAAGARALAEAQVAEAGAAEHLARYRLQALGAPLPASPEIVPEPLPAATHEAMSHPRVQSLQGRAEVARQQAALARVQSRSNPELTISTRRDRSTGGEAFDQTWALALRLPFGGGPRHEARLAIANAEAVEAEVELQREQARISAEQGAYAAWVEAARQQALAAAQRAELARENRLLYDKSFSLGETDLPTRLRIESEAMEAERALVRARIALAQGISQWRQALGLLPE